MPGKEGSVGPQSLGTSKEVMVEHVVLQEALGRVEGALGEEERIMLW